MTLQHLIAAVIEHHLIVECIQLAAAAAAAAAAVVAAAAHVKTVAAESDNTPALKKFETAAASVTDVLEHYFAQTSLAPTAVKLELVA